MRQLNYDKAPKISFPEHAGACVEGWEGCAKQVYRKIQSRKTARTIVSIECYPGVNEAEIIEELKKRLAPAVLIKSSEAMLSPADVDNLVAPFLGGDDPVFGFLCGLTLAQFFDPGKVQAVRAEIDRTESGLVLIIGCGASHLTWGDLLIYADLPRWETQLRFRRNETSNLGVDNKTLAASLQYKRAFFVDWRVADRCKRELMAHWHFVLDTTIAGKPKLAEGEAIRQALRETARRPFRVVPFFDPAPWGGQWMREACKLDTGAPNYGWCFDCVPEENSLLLEFGEVTIEIPAINLVFQEPRSLLGEAVHARFGDEFPIRFDFLDTMKGGNLSFQVHPLTEYIQHHFGMHYTQDESYYLLDAGADAKVYLGLREGIDRRAMMADLKASEKGAPPFPVEKYVNCFPAKKHDHFLIPAGTVHCSGAESMVLEISATPYIFTFKMWDWGRVGLDGKPRPIHLDHGIANIQWDRTTHWVKGNLVNRFTAIANGDGWKEEITGLHEREFIETRRHWFTKEITHHTQGGVNVINLVEGDEISVESPEGFFKPFTVHYAETFIVPAAVGSYRIRPITSRSGTWATMKAFVRDSVAPSVRHNNEAAVSTARPPVSKAEVSPQPV